MGGGAGCTECFQILTKPAAIHGTCRSELVREKPQSATKHLVLRNIIHHHQRNTAKSRLATPIENRSLQLAWLTPWRCHMTERLQINMHEAQSQLSQLDERALRGDTVLITKAGKPYLSLLPHAETSRARKPGRLKGRVRMSANFD